MWIILCVMGPCNVDPVSDVKSIKYPLIAVDTENFTSIYSFALNI
jgi:hypothetical protein